jgi:hypothetical protein
VDRDKEIATIEALSRQIIETGRQPGLPHVIAMRGQRGTGKTWLCLHLKRSVLSKMPRVISLLLNPVSTFDPAYKPQGLVAYKGEKFLSLDQSPYRPDDFCINILKWMAENLGTTRAEHADSTELSNWMTRDIKQKLSNNMIILILDSIFEIDWSYLKKLEEDVLVPLATLPNTLLIMTGRGNFYPWTSPYLRMAAETNLGALTDLDTKEQLRLQASGENLSSRQLKEITEISSGNPLINLLIAGNLDRKTVLDEAANLLLDIRSNKYRPEIRDYFEALSILDGFDDEEIAPMLSAFNQDSKIETTWTDERKRAVKEMMIRTHLIRWENGRYVMDDSLRRVLDTYLKLSEEEKWRRLHRRAMSLYEEWARTYKKHSKYFMSKARLHSEALARIDSSSSTS